MKKVAIFNYSIFLITLLIQIIYVFFDALTLTTKERIFLFSIQFIFYVMASKCMKKIVKNPKQFEKKATLFLFLLYCINLSYLLFLDPYYGRTSDFSFIDYQTYIDQNVNLVPFKSISLFLISYIKHYLSFTQVVINLVGNFVVFMPFSYFLPYFFQSLEKVLPFFISMVIIVFFVEFLQVVLQTGTGDIDDIIFNVGGCMVAYGLLHMSWVRDHIFERDKDEEEC